MAGERLDAVWWVLAWLDTLGMLWAAVLSRRPGPSTARSSLRLSSSSVRAVTELPSRAASCFPSISQAWIKHPLIDIEAIQQRHDVVEGLAEDAQLRADLRGLHLRGEGCCWGACSVCRHVRFVASCHLCCVGAATGLLLQQHTMVRSLTPHVC